MDELFLEQLAERKLERRAEEVAAQQHEKRHVVGIDKAPDGVVPKVVSGDLFNGVAQKYARYGEEFQEIQVGDALLLYIHGANKITVIVQKVVAFAF